MQLTLKNFILLLLGNLDSPLGKDLPLLDDSHLYVALEDLPFVCGLPHVLAVHKLGLDDICNNLLRDRTQIGALCTCFEDLATL